MTGSYISDDGGDSWRMFNLRIRSASAPSIRWIPTPCMPRGWHCGAAPMAAGILAGRLSDPDTVAGVASPAITPKRASSSMVRRPHDKRPGCGCASKVLYAAAGNSLLIPTDWGATSTLVGRPVRRCPRHLRRSRLAPVTGPYIYRHPQGDGPPRQPLAAGLRTRGNLRLHRCGLGFPAEGAPVIYAVAGRMLVSEDAGSNWKDALPGARTEVASVATSLYHGDVVYVSYSSLTEPDGRLLVRRGSQQRPRPHLGTGLEVRQPARRNIEDGWMPGASARAGPAIHRPGGGARRPRTSAMAPITAAPSAALDGGQTWKAVYSTKPEDGSYTSHRPRRYHRLRAPLGPLPHRARLHQLHQHRALPQRERRHRAGSTPAPASRGRAGATQPTGWSSIPM